MKRILASLFAILTLVAAVPAGAATTTVATTTDTAALMQLIADLTAQIESLKVKILALQTETNNALLKIRTELRAGTTGEEVRTLQKILATDPSIYPEKLVTGFFGPLTEKAVKRLQEKFKLEVKGAVGPETLELINAILTAQGVNSDDLPQDLLISGANKVKVEIETENGRVKYKIEVKCDSSGSGNLCKDSDDDADSDEDSEDADDMDDSDDEDDDADDDEDSDDESDDDDEDDEDDN